PIVALGITAAAPAANAGVVQLGFILDRSGSIGSSPWSTITTGLSNAINTLVPIDGSYEISVVSFATSASINVNKVLIDSAIARANVAAAIASIGYTGGNTNMTAAFNSMAAALGGSTNMIDFSYVNLATDGIANNAGTAATARNNLVTAGADNISIEAIGGGVDAMFLQNSICYPGPCTVAPTFAFPGNGFYIPVANATEYSGAIGNKIAIVTQQVPEPGMALIVALGVVGIAAARRKAA
ncbi:MAG: hypothetical protein ACI9MU_002173, partial [Alphaproteobacteria bacterium]